jgi:circadian clock protein KaiB
MPGKKQDKSKSKIKDKEAEVEKYILRLFISGILPNSVRSVINVKNICEKYLKDRYELEIIDIYQQPDLAFSEDIIAIPVLIKKFPLPEVKMIGDLSDTGKVLNGLGISEDF